MVTDDAVDKVIIVSDERYTEKSNERLGGARAEAQIISKELFEKRDQSKFAALIRERDGEGRAHLPAYYTSRIYIDFSEPDRYADSFEQLLRWLFDKPLNVRPALGNKPAFLSDEKGIRLATNAEFMRAQSAIKEGRDHALPAVRDFFAKLIEQLPLLRFEGKPQDDFEVFKNNLSEFIPYRNQVIEIVGLVARGRMGIEYYEAIHRFIEDFMHLFHPAEGVHQWSDLDFENYKFWGYETFQYIAAILIRERAFDGFDIVMTRPFYIQNSRRNEKTAFVADLFFHSRLFDFWNDQQGLRKLSLVAHFVHERSTGSGVRFYDLAQADFILYLRSLVSQIHGGGDDRWYPILMIYNDRYSGALEMFARAVSAKEFQTALRFLGLPDKSAFDAIVQPFLDGSRQGPNFGGFDSVHPPALVGYDKICTRP